MDNMEDIQSLLEGMDAEGVAEVLEALSEVADAVNDDAPVEDRLMELEMNLAMSGVCIDKLTEIILDLSQRVADLESKARE